MSILLAVMLLFAGCTTTSRLHDATMSPETIDELNRKTAGHEVQVILLDDRWMVGYLTFSTDSVRVLSGSGLAHVPIDHVHAIDIPARRRGALIGAGVGLLAGIGAAAVAIWAGDEASSTEGNCLFGDTQDCNLFDGLARTVAIATLVVPAGVGVGALIGRNTGTERIVLNER
jgi:hypothetical protein